MDVTMTTITFNSPVGRDIFDLLSFFSQAIPLIVRFLFISLRLADSP